MSTSTTTIIIDRIPITFSGDQEVTARRCVGLFDCLAETVTVEGVPVLQLAADQQSHQLVRGEVMSVAIS